MAKIIWADPAIQELDGIADYIALDNPAAARHLAQQVFAAVQKLRKFPHSGSIPSEPRGLPYRQLIVSPCRVFYRIEGKVVYIVHILRGELLVRRESFPSQPRVPRSPREGSTGRRKGA